MKHMIRVHAPQRGLECIFGDGDTVCLRPALVSSGGVPVPRPDPLGPEYVCVQTAFQILGIAAAAGPDRDCD